MSNLESGSVRHTVLVYAVSEPGGWTVDSIAEDLPGLGLDDIRSAASDLFDGSFIHINSFDRRLWPMRSGREAIAQAC